jgi:hypothetical protein
MLAMGSSLVLLALSQAPPVVEPDSTYECAPPAGETAYISRIASEGTRMVLRGKGFSTRPFLLLVDDLVVNGPTISDTEISFPLESYPGKKILPARVEVLLKGSDKSLVSNRCTVEYPGLFPLWIGGASGLSFAGRGGEPAAMVVGFLGLNGSAQPGSPTKRFNKRENKWVQMGWVARALRRSFVVVGTTKVGSLDWGATLGFGFKLGELRVLYACRFQDHQYPRHMIGIAGAFNVHSVVRRAQGTTEPASTKASP